MIRRAPVRAAIGLVLLAMGPIAVLVATPPPAAAATAARSRARVYVTGYTWFDNTPRGSARISNPVLHRSAGGTGTYADPVTLAVGHVIRRGRDVLDLRAGTRVYLPHLHRYGISDGDGRGLRTVVVDPPPGYPVHAGPPFSGGRCTV
jgi:hypothetical protein